MSDTLFTYYKVRLCFAKNISCKYNNLYVMKNFDIYWFNKINQNNRKKSKILITRLFKKEREKKIFNLFLNCYF